AVTFSRLLAYLTRACRLGRCAGGRGSGIRRGPQAAGHRGTVCGSRRAVGLASEGRGEAAAPQWRDPRVNPGRLRRSPWALFPLDCSRPSSLLKAQGGQAWRAGGAPLKTVVEKVVTTCRGTPGHLAGRQKNSSAG